MRPSESSYRLFIAFMLDIGLRPIIGQVIYKIEEVLIRTSPRLIFDWSVEI